MLYGDCSAGDNFRGGGGSLPLGIPKLPLPHAHPNAQAHAAVRVSIFGNPSAAESSGITFQRTCRSKHLYKKYEGRGDRAHSRHPLNFAWGGGGGYCHVPERGHFPTKLFTHEVPPHPCSRRESPWWSCDRGARAKNRSQGSATPRCPVRGRPHWRSTVR